MLFDPVMLTVISINPLVLIAGSKILCKCLKTAFDLCISKSYKKD